MRILLMHLYIYAMLVCKYCWYALREDQSPTRLFSKIELYAKLISLWVVYIWWQMDTNACIYALCIPGGSHFMHGSVCILQDTNFELCLNKIGAWGQKLWTIAISFGGACWAITYHCAVSWGCRRWWSSCRSSRRSPSCNWGQVSTSQPTGQWSSSGICWLLSPSS